VAIANASALSGAWEDALATDVGGTVAFLEEAAERIADGGAITYVASKAAGIATPSLPAYGASKAAMLHYAKSLSQALAHRGIRVNAVSPGDTFVEDGFWNGIRRNAPEAYAAALTGNSMGRLDTPDEIARVVVFVSSPAASFVSGCNWSVDGGATSHVRL
jgi:NAD(P)-dependent dehydrogenase (short-subunit alcohol dehydrogenase family)